jgi:hypothetical protein
MPRLYSIRELNYTVEIKFDKKSETKMATKTLILLFGPMLLLILASLINYIFHASSSACAAKPVKKSNSSKNSNSKGKK